MSEFVKIDQHGSVAVLTISNPPVNAVSTEVLAWLLRAVRDVHRDPATTALVIVGEGATFVAGFDIKELQRIQRRETADLDLYPLLNQLEESSKPVVAAIAGTALGGGLELAMAAHYRVCTPHAKLGQPEVTLGLIPGMGGTQRLPRLVGVDQALNMCTSGEPIGVDQALHWGLIDAVITGDLIEGAVQFAANAVDARRTRKLAIGTFQDEVFVKAHATTDAKKRMQRAPHAAIEAIEAATMMDFEAGCKREQSLFEECLHGPQSRALIHLFFAERAAGKFNSSEPPRPIQRVGVLGAGTMGCGITVALANAGLSVVLKDVSPVATECGFWRVADTYATSVSKGKLTSENARARLDRIKAQSTWNDFDTLDLVVEAVFESTAAKQAAFAALAAHTRPDCLLASNTSTLHIQTITESIPDHARVAGLHFFSPANIMKLVEVIRTPETSEATVATLIHLAKRLGKIPVLAEDRFGFVGNRMMIPYLEQAYECLEIGATVEQVNAALTEFGMAMGPLAMEDQIGIDVTHAIREEAKRAGLLRENHSSIADVLHELGRYGQKTGKGWSRYGEDRCPQADPDVDAIVASHRRRQSNVTNTDIVERCIGALVKEGRAVLAEGVAARSADIDVVWVYGYGFPAWRGGPMFYADCKEEQCQTASASR